MSPTQTLVVVGATGAQGSSVIKSIVPDNVYHIRGLTRNIGSKKALALKDLGVEVVECDLNSPVSIAAAFNQATAIYAMTDFWGPFMDPTNQSKLKSGQTINEWAYEHELQQAKNIMQAAAKVPTLTHFIWSSLPSAKKWSRGKYTWVYHFDSKAAATEYLEETHADLWARTSVLIMGRYLTNHLYVPSLQPHKRPDGIYELRLPCPPDAPWPYVDAAHDTGPFVKILLARGPSPGKNFLTCRAYMSPGDFLKTWGEVNNVQTEYQRITVEEMAADESFGREGGESYGFVGDFGHEAREDASIVHPIELGLSKSLPSVYAWIKQQDWSNVLNG